MSEILMYDTASEGNIAKIPHDAKAVAGYTDGNYRTFEGLVKRFYPHAHCVSIGVFLGHLSEFSDVEPGNPITTHELVRADFLHRRANGVWRPGFYGDQTRMESVIIPGLVGIARSEYRLWLADPNRIRKIRPGFDAQQIEFDGIYDVSLVNVEAFFPPHLHKKLRGHPLRHVPKVLHHLHHLHPKVRGAVGGGGLATGLVTLLHSVMGLTMTPTEGAAIAGALATLLGYLAPPVKK